MTADQSHEKRQQWIIDYLYDNLSAEDKNVFEAALAQDQQLKALYDEHCGLDALMPKGTQPLIDDARMQGLRWSAFRALRTPPKASLWQRFKNAWQLQVSLKSQVLAMAIMFGLGFYISESFITDELSPKAGEKNIATQTVPAQGNASQSGNLLSLLNEKDYQVVDLNLARYDAEKGEVEFSFSLSSQSTVSGNLQNPQIRDLLLRSFNSETQDQVRLQLTSLLGDYSDAQDVQASLINTLLNDPNPGVRYNAVENLVKVAERPNVRMALLNALAHDVNPGIRVEAFLATSDKMDEALLQVLKNYSVDDANTFIRERSKRILLELQGNGESTKTKIKNLPDTI